MKTARRIFLGVLFGLIFFIGFHLSSSLILANVNPTENFFVNDFAGVLSQDTANYLTQRGMNLEAISTAQVVVTTVRFTDGVLIADYALDMFNRWGIGGAGEDNGILLLIVTGQDDYYLIRGDGVPGIVSDGELFTIINTVLEPNFDANLDYGVRQSLSQIHDRVYSFYAGAAPPAAAPAPVPAPVAEIPANPLNTVFNVLMLTLFIIIIVSFFSSFTRRRSRGMRGMWGRPRRSGGSFAGGFLTGMLLGSSRNRSRGGRINRGGGLGGGMGGGFGRGGGTRPGGGRASGGFGRSGSTRIGGGGRSSGGGFGRRK